MSNFAFDNPTEELVSRLSGELDTLRQRRQEIENQVETYEQMVRREEKRNQDVLNSMRQLEDNFDTMPRDDIKARYDEAMDAKTRLATMRGQLDQYRGTHDVIAEEISLIQDVMGRLQGGSIEMADPAEPEAANSTPSSGSLNIVRIVQAQEDERRRLANQIHDGPAQSLTNFMLQTEIVQRLFERNPEAAKEELTNLREAASLTFQRVREFISDLRPMMLDDLGIIPTAKRYIQQFGSKSDIDIKEHINGQEDRRLEEYQEVMLFRGLQDLMAHARDNAEATEIHVWIDVDRTEAHISVEDNGRDFDAESALASDHPEDPRAQGILTLREKFDLIGGEVAVTNSQRGNTQVEIRMPITDRGT